MEPQQNRLYNFIGGEFVPAESKNTFVKASPFDGRVLSEVAASEPIDVIKALQGAKKAAPAFSALPLLQRSQLVLKIADHLEENILSYSYLEALHQGLSQDFSKVNNLQVAIQVLRKAASVTEVESNIPAGKIYSQPVGVVGIITSWACSLRLIAERLGPALMAGNVCLVKVSEYSPISALIVGEACKAADIPPGVVQLLQGNGEVGAFLASHPGIRAVTAATSTSTMENIAKVGAMQLKKLQLSGGAKNAAIVLAGTDYRQRMPEILYPFLMGQGQLCWNISRLFILESFAKDFVLAAQEYLETLKPLLDPKGSEVWTPLISSNTITKIQRKTEEAQGEQGKLIFGASHKAVEAGTETSGFFKRPAVMLDLPNCSVLQQEDLQGPLLLITAVKYQHEAVKWANTSYLGHSAIVWGPEEKLEKVGAQLECSQVWLNSWMKGEVQSVFGQRQSSFGDPNMNSHGSFYSDVKKLTGAR